MTREKHERLERLREILLEEKRKLWNEFRDEVFRGQEQLHAEFDIPHDIGELSMLDVLADTGLAIGDILRQRLTQMEIAEQKLRDGTFGICEDCGAEIEEERLKVVPYAVKCVRCKEESEGVAYPPEHTI